MQNLCPSCLLDLYSQLTSVSICVCFQGRSDAITAVKLLSCFDDLVAVGTASGRVAVFQLVSPLPGRNKQVRHSADVLDDADQWKCDVVVFEQQKRKRWALCTRFYTIDIMFSLSLCISSCDVSMSLASTRVPSRL